VSETEDIDECARLAAPGRLLGRGPRSPRGARMMRLPSSSMKRSMGVNAMCPLPDVFHGLG